MATRTIKAAGGNSNVAGTYEENAVPTASDDIVARADGTSGNFVIAANLSCRSFNLTSSSVSGGTYSGSITRTAGNLSIGTSTAPPSGIAFAISATTTWNVVGTIIFLTTHTTAQSMVTNGVSINSPLSLATGSGCLIQTSGALTCTASSTALTINSGGSTWKFGATATFSNTVSLQSGTIDINGQSLTVNTLAVANNAVARVLAMGSGGSITCTGSGTSLNAQGTVTNFSTTGSGTITVSGASGAAALRGADWSGTANGITIDFTGSGAPTLNHGTAGTAVGTVGNLSRHGTAVKTCEFVIDGDVTVGGTLTLNGEGTTGNRLLVRTTTRGTTRTITCNGNVATSSQYVDFRDITGAGSASWNLASITGNSGDALGNSGITFTTATTQTYVGTGSNSASNAAVWTSCIPLPQDNVVVASGTGTLTFDMPRSGKDHDFTGYTATANIQNVEIHGNLTLASGMTLSGTGGITFVGRGSHTITSNGAVFVGPTIFDATSNGTYALADAYSNSRSANALTLTTGTFDANDMAVTFTGALATAVFTTGTLLMGNGTWHFSGLTTTSTPWAVAAAVTITAEGSTLKFTSVTSSNTKTIQAGAGGGKVYNIIETAGTVGTFFFSNNIRIKELKSLGTHSVSVSSGGAGLVIQNLLRLKQGVTFKSGTGGTSVPISLLPGCTVNVAGATLQDVQAVTSGPIHNVGTVSNVSGTTHTCPVPQAARDINGLVLVAAVSVTHGQTITAPAGWTLYDSVATSDVTINGNKLALYWRVTSSEPATYDWTTSNGAGWAGVVQAALFGVDTTTPFEDEDEIAVEPASYSTIVIPEVDPTSNTDLLLAVYAISLSATRTWTPPTGMIEAADTASSISLGMAWQQLTSGAATGSRTATLSSATNQGGTGLMVACKPAASPPDTTVYATNTSNNVGWTFNTTRTISNAGGNYNDPAAWVEDAIPTAVDDVVATGTSGNLAVNVNSVARSVDLNTYVGTLSGNADLTLGTTTAPPNARVFRFSTGMTTTWTGQIQLGSTHGTAQTITFNGKTHAGTIAVQTANIELADTFAMTGALTITAGGTCKLLADGSVNNCTLTSGTLDINGRTLTQTSTSTGFTINTGASTKVFAMGTGGMIITPPLNCGTQHAVDHKSHCHRHRHLSLHGHINGNHRVARR